MDFIQPPVSPLPDNLHFGGKVAIVTGANSGLGMEIARQLLERGVATLILAVRTVAKGEAARTQLLSEANIKQKNPQANVQVVKLDVASYQSVKDFTTTIRSRLERLDMLILNAGIGFMPRETTVDNHESTLQVNYLSNVLLLFELLPLLESTSMASGQPSRVTITGSRRQYDTALAEKPPTKDQALFEYIDRPDTYKFYKRYGDSKLLVHLFLVRLSRQYSPSRVIINQFCPGMIGGTDLDKNLSSWMRLVAKALKAFSARPPHVGGWIALHAAAVAGPESHGLILIDKNLADLKKDSFIHSSLGHELQAKLWSETLKEMEPLTTIPDWALAATSHT